MTLFLLSFYVVSNVLCVLKSEYNFGGQDGVINEKTDSIL